jgi:hypothetical protein
MYYPAVMAVTASVPWFATYLAENDSDQVSGDLVAIAYMCAIGLLISFAAILDDTHDLTAWFGIAMELSPFI